jgi:hypothetical protein
VQLHPFRPLTCSTPSVQKEEKKKRTQLFCPGAK